MVDLSIVARNTMTFQPRKCFFSSCAVRVGSRIGSVFLYSPSWQCWAVLPNWIEMSGLGNGKLDRGVSRPGRRGCRYSPRSQTWGGGGGTVSVATDGAGSPPRLHRYPY